MRSWISLKAARSWAFTSGADGLGGSGRSFSAEGCGLGGETGSAGVGGFPEGILTPARPNTTNARESAIAIAGRRRCLGWVCLSGGGVGTAWGGEIGGVRSPPQRLIVSVGRSLTVSSGSRSSARLSEAAIAWSSRDHFGGALGSGGRLLGEQPVEEGHEARWETRPQRVHTGRPLGDHLVQGLQRIGALERGDPRQHLVEQRRRGRRDPNARRSRPPLACSGDIERQVPTTCPAAVREGSSAAIPIGFARPKSRILALPRGGDHHVLGLEVAMDEAGLVGGGEPGGDLLGQAHGERRLQGARRSESRPGSPLGRTP